MTIPAGKHFICVCFTIIESFKATARVLGELYAKEDKNLAYKTPKKPQMGTILKFTKNMDLGNHAPATGRLWDFNTA